MEKYHIRHRAPAEALLATLTGTSGGSRCRTRRWTRVNSVEVTMSWGARCRSTAPPMSQKAGAHERETKAPPPALTALGLRLISDGGDSVTL